MRREGEPVRIGIDLGTTTTLVGILCDGEIKILELEPGVRCLPSVVNLMSGREYIVGRSAMVSTEGTTIREMKRFMGKKLSNSKTSDKQLKALVDKVNELYSKNEDKKWGYTIKSDKDGYLLVNVIESGEQQESIISLKPQDIAFFILYKIKKAVMTYLNIDESTPIEVVIGVPASYSAASIDATIEAIEMAGMRYYRSVKEPVAAATCKKQNEEGYYVYFDFGGGTLDIAVVELSHGQLIEKKSVGDPQLGGNDIDYKIIEFITEEMKNKLEEQIEEDIVEGLMKNISNIKLKEEAERGKIRLSEEYNRAPADKAEFVSVKWNVSSFFNNDGRRVLKERDLEDEVTIEITYMKLEEMCNDLFKRCIATLDNGLKTLNLTKYDIKKVVMVGGSCKMPGIYNRLCDYFIKPELIDKNLDDLELLVCKGCTLIANNVTVYPCIFDKSSMATIHDIGVRTADDTIDVILPAKSKVGTSKSEVYQTTHDYQNEISAEVMEGDTPIGNIQVKVPPMPASEVEVTVTFTLLDDQSVDISARVSKPEKLDKSYKKPVTIKVHPEWRKFSKEETAEQAQYLLSIYSSDN